MSLVRTHGRAPRGERLFDHVPTSLWRNDTLISGLRCDGIIAPFVFPGALNTQALRVWVKNILIPSLRPGDIVTWDKFSVHKDQNVLALLAEHGVQLRYTPAYSPDLNPIEQAWSKLKSILRRLRAESWDTLIDAISEGLGAISANDCLGWFKHVGCRV
jgi:transposase